MFLFSIMSKDNTIQYKQDWDIKSRAMNADPLNKYMGLSYI